jgi:RHS repeat-associated protein
MHPLPSPTRSDPPAYIGHRCKWHRIPASRNLSQPGQIDPAGLDWARTYEASTGRTDTLTVMRDATEVFFSDLDYDPAGNVTARTQRVGGLADAWTYDYDPAGRMVAADGPGTASDASYGWDGASNRISLTVAGATDATVYDTAGLPVSSSGASGSVTYAHDGEGNLTAIDRPGTSTDLELTYDGWGQMVSSRTGGGTGPLTTYGIDPLGRLVTKTTNSTTTAIDHRGLSEDPIRVAEGSTPATTYAWGISGAIATATDGVTRMLVRDLHGDVVAATDAAGALESTHRYTPWGETRAVTDPAEPEPAGTTRLGFQGEPTHAEAGIVDMGIRFYLPVLGRFTTRDVLFGELTSPGSLNQYGYGAANPITFIDPTGMKPCDPSKGRCVHSPYGSSTSGGSMAQAHQNYQAAHPPSSPGSSYASPTATTSRPARPAPPPSPKAPPGIGRFVAQMEDPSLSWEARSAAADALIAEHPRMGPARVTEWLTSTFGPMNADLGIVWHEGQLRPGRSSWWIVRAYLNRDITGEFLAFAGNTGANCTLSRRAFWLCTGAARGTYGGAGTTYGNVFITRLSNVPVPLQRHEEVHASQWARYGPDFYNIYLAVHLYFSPGNGCNYFEEEAGFRRGGYRWCL